MSKELTRRELYDMVWARPMTKVAAELCISDVALNKICKKHRVPVPGRGYWAKVAAGQRPKQRLFHAVQDPVLNRVYIHGSPIQALPPEVKEARERAIATARAVAPKPVAVAPNLGPLHPAVERLKLKLEKTKVGGDGFVRISGRQLFAVAVSPAATDRLIAILDNLVRQAEARGYRLEPGDQALQLVVDDEALSLAISERTERVAHQQTEKEAAALQRWEADCERKRRRGEWISQWDKPSIPEWDHNPNGQLVLEMDKDNQWDGLRRKFADGKRQQLEFMIDVILTAAATCAAARKAKRAEMERRQREWAEEEKRRRETERRRTLEAKRWEFLDRQIRLNERARRIDAFIADYLSRHPEEQLPPSCQQLIAWARRYADAARDAVAPERLVPTLDHYTLMDDATEIGSWVKFD